KLPPEPRAPAQLVVPGHPSVRQARAALVEHLQGQLVPGTKPDGRRHPGLPTSPLAARPLLREVQPDVHQGVLVAGGVGQVDADLAVVDLATPAAPPPPDPDRLPSLLWERRPV